MSNASSSSNRFPSTRISAIAAAASADGGTRARGLAAVAAAYRLPVYTYIRLRWNRERDEAEDLTHGFFAELIERNLLGRYDPSRARFRTYLRTCLDGFVANHMKAERRIKRGGDAEHIALDAEEAERAIAAAGAVSDADACFDREFVRSLYMLAVRRVQAALADAGRPVHTALLERVVLADDADGPPPSYRELAGEFGVTTVAVTNYLAAIRRDLRRALLDALHELTASEEEFRSEAALLLGVTAA
ncbi:MAG: hypothetical protein JST22_19200 [Bacteroidetes bacterium]|nr:hypothetical protein [Bacteroidota bacterium]